MAVPVRIISGDAVEWAVSGFVGSDEATYQYYWVGPSKKTITATYADGVLSASFSAEDSAGLEAGQYRWALSETIGAARKTLERGYIYVESNFATEDETDNREHAEIMLDAIEAKLEGRVTLDQERYTIQGRSWDRVPIEELKRLRRDYRWEVYKINVRRGLRKPRRRIKYNLS